MHTDKHAETSDKNVEPKDKIRGNNRVYANALCILLIAEMCAAAGGEMSGNKLPKFWESAGERSDYSQAMEELGLSSHGESTISVEESDAVVESAGKKHTKSSSSRAASTPKKVIAGPSGNTTASASTTPPKTGVSTSAPKPASTDTENAVSTTAMAVESTASVQQPNMNKTAANVVASTPDKANTGSHMFGCAVHIHT